MKYTMTIAVAVILASATATFSQQQAGVAAAQPNAALRTVEINDPALQMRAATLQIPADWKFAGIIDRPRGCHAVDAHAKWVAQSGDGLTAIQIFPGYRWADSTSPSMLKVMAQNGCPGVGMSTATEFLKNVALPNLRPSATLDQIGPMGPVDQEKLQESLNKMQADEDAQTARFRQMGLPRAQSAHHTLDGAIAHLHYSMNGHEVDETIGAVVHCADKRNPGNYVERPSMSHNCNTFPVVILRAPKGTLDGARASLIAIRASYRMDQNWDMRMAQISKQQSDQAIAASNAQFNQMMKNNDALQAQRTQQWQANEAARQASVDHSIANARAQQNAMDQSAHNTVLYALDEKAYVNPQNGQEIDLSNKYNHAYLSSDGTTVLQNNNGFNPNGYTPGTTWSPLEPK